MYLNSLLTIWWSCYELAYLQEMPSKSTEPPSGEMMMLKVDDFCLGSSL